MFASFWKNLSTPTCSSCVIQLWVDNCFDLSIVAMTINVVYARVGGSQCKMHVQWKTTYGHTRLACLVILNSRKSYLSIIVMRFVVVFWKSWAGEIELAALAEIYHRKIEVYHYHSNQVAIKSFGRNSSGEATILLAYSDGNHYDSIMTKEYRNDSAVCQCKSISLLKSCTNIYVTFTAILYELLFKSVFKQPVPKRQDLQVYSRQRKEYLGDSSLKNFCSDDLMAFSSKVYFNAALGVHKTYKEGKLIIDTCLLHQLWPVSCMSRLSMIIELY